MAPREPEESLLADAVLRQLTRIQRDGGKAKWLTQPAVIEEAPIGTTPQNDLPGLYLHLADWKDTALIGQGMHEAVATFHVWMCSAHLASATREHQRLCKDVRNAIAEGEAAIENALKIPGDPYTGDGSVVITPVGYTYHHELSERIGLAIGSYVFTITYVWQHNRHQPTASAPAEVEDDVRHPFEFRFPETGRMLTGRPIAPLISPPYLSEGATLTVFDSPVGTRGIVRNINIISVASEGGGPAFPGLTFEVRYDGSDTPAISVPLFTMFGMEHLADQLPDLEFETPAFEVGNAFFQSEDPGLIRHFLGCIKLPMPFTNGINIRVVAANDERINTLFANVIYQDELSPTAWNSNLRLFAARSNEVLPAVVQGANDWKLESPTSGVTVTGTFPANIAGRCIQAQGGMANTDYIVVARPDATHITLDPKETEDTLLDTPGQLVHGAVHTFLSVPSPLAGYVAMVVGSHTTEPAFMECNPRFYLDGNASPDLRWTSVEDMFNGAFFFVYPNQGWDGGVTAIGGVTGGYSYYKNFWNNPIRFANGIVGKVPHSFDGQAITVNWTTFYYIET